MPGTESPAAGRLTHPRCLVRTTNAVSQAGHDIMGHTSTQGPLSLQVTHANGSVVGTTDKYVHRSHATAVSPTLSLAREGLTGAPTAFCAPDFSRAKRSKSRSLDLRALSRQARGSSMHRTARSSTSRLAPQAATGSAGRAGIVIMAARPNSRQPCACPAAVQ
jgi:hypothetical protein